MADMRALVADDEPHLADYLVARLAVLWPSLEICAIAHEGVEAARQLSELRPDIAFLDIRMPGKSGLEVAQGLEFPCRIVFVTAYDEFAVAAFEHAAVDYLLKPVSDDRLRDTVRRLQHSPASEPEELIAQLKKLLPQGEPKSHLSWVRASVGSTVRLIAVEDVCFFMAADKYTLVATRDGDSLIRTSIRELVDQLDPALFWQVHRGTLVNVRQVVSATHDANGKTVLRLRDRPETIAVSRASAHLFRQM